MIIAVTEKGEKMSDFAKDTNVPINDCISRQAAIEEAKKHWYKPDIAGALAELPSAQQWIPVSERLPEEDLWTGDGKQLSNSVLMTVYDENDEDLIVDYGHTKDGEWYSETADEFIECIADWKVTAWMPLPEPWKGGAE